MLSYQAALLLCCWLDWYCIFGMFTEVALFVLFVTKGTFALAWIRGGSLLLDHIYICTFCQWLVAISLVLWAAMSLLVTQIVMYFQHIALQPWHEVSLISWPPWAASSPLYMLLLLFLLSSCGLPLTPHSISSSWSCYLPPSWNLVLIIPLFKLCHYFLNFFHSMVYHPSFANNGHIVSQESLLHFLLLSLWIVFLPSFESGKLLPGYPSNDIVRWCGSAFPETPIWNPALILYMVLSGGSFCVHNTSFPAVVLEDHPKGRFFIFQFVKLC